MQLNPAGFDYSFPSNRPIKRIDYVWSSAAFAPTLQTVCFASPVNETYGYCRGGTLFLSDHLGLQATFDLVREALAHLGDLPVEVLQTAIARILLEHSFSTIPTIAEIRKMADAIQVNGRFIDTSLSWGRLTPE